MILPLLAMVQSTGEHPTDPKFERDLITGLISLILLAVTERSREPLYGYRIAQELGAEGEGEVALKQGTIYPVLRTLEKKGLLSSEIRPSESGPPRKYYSITEEGRNSLVIWRATWAKTAHYVDTVLSGGADA